MERFGTLSTPPLPPLAAAMTPADLAVYRAHLMALLGTGADVSLLVGYERDAIVFIYPDRTRSNPQTVRGCTWDVALTEAATWITSNAVARRAALVRRLALAVIDLTDAHGECREARLVAAGFAKTEIAEHHAAACDLAAEMCVRANFTVILEG